MLMLDDLSRAAQLTSHWAKVDSQKEYHYPKPISHQQFQISKLPYLTRNYNSVEKNIFAVSNLNKSYSKMLESPQHSFDSLTQEGENVSLGHCAMPSLSYTKSQNKKILDKLVKSFAVLKGCETKNQESFIKSKMRIKKSFLRDGSFITSQKQLESTMLGQSDHQESKAEQLHDSKFIIDRKTCFKDGVKYPYRLYVINNSRQQIIEQLMDREKRKENLNKFGDQQQTYFDEVKKQNESQMRNEVKVNQIKKKKSELISRGSLTNAYYSLMALDKISQTRVRGQYKSQQPVDSRYYQI